MLRSYHQENNERGGGSVPSAWQWSCAGCGGVCNLIRVDGLLWPCQRWRVQKETVRPESALPCIGSQSFFIVLTKAYWFGVDTVGITKDMHIDSLRYFQKSFF